MVGGRSAPFHVNGFQAGLGNYLPKATNQTWGKEPQKSKATFTLSF